MSFFGGAYSPPAPSRILQLHLRHTYPSPPPPRPPTAAPGVIGDLREYGGNMLRCFCCVMVAGPLCLIGSAAMFKSSLTDTRGALLEAYTLSVTDWPTHAKSWDAAAFEFKASKCGAGGCSSSSTFVRFTGAKTAANEDVHDTPQSGESWSIPADVQKFEPQPAGWAAFASGITAADLAANNFAFSVVDPNVASGEKVVASLANVPLTRISSHTLSWRPSSSTSSSSSVDCRWRQAPSGTYSGSRWGDKVSCVSHCASRYGGVLSVAGAGRSAVVRCATTFGVAAIELRVRKEDPDSANVATNAAYAFAADAGPNPALGVSMACSEPGAALQTELCSGAVYTSDGAWLAQTAQGDDGWFGVRYRSGPDIAAAARGSTIDAATWLKAIAFSVRHEADPYVAASKLTGGCSSCTDRPQRSAVAPCSTRCFGLTAGEKKQIALALLVLGLLLCIPPYLIVRYVRQRKGQQRNGGGGGAGAGGGAPRAGYPGAGVVPVQQMAPMQVQQGVPMYAQPGQQPPQQQMMYPASQQQPQQVMVNQYGQPVQMQQMMQPQQVMVNQYGQPMQQQQQQQPVVYAQQPGQASY